MVTKIIACWCCQKCRKQGEIVFFTSDSILEVYSRINDAHYNNNRFCEYEFNRIRIYLKKVNMI